MPVSPTANTDYYAKCELTINGISCISAVSNIATITIAGALNNPMIVKRFDQNIRFITNYKEEIAIDNYGDFWLSDGTLEGTKKLKKMLVI